MNIQYNLEHLKEEINNEHVVVVAVSKTKPVSLIMQAYEAYHRHFGENKVQELVEKYNSMPKDICWHMIGHLQRNKVKYIAEFVWLIHSVDSLKLLKEINKQALKHVRIINCLLQVHIADEETKFGFAPHELLALFEVGELVGLKGICVKGLMGMATFTDDRAKIRNEFKTLKTLYDKVKSEFNRENVDFEYLSMGMSGDYQIALEEGSNMIRIGSYIFGTRN